MLRSAVRSRGPALAFVLLAPGARLAAQVVEFPVPTANSRPYTIVAGPDGNLWFTESVGNNVGRITPEGTITEFPVPTPASGPYGIAVGADGNVWFTERLGNQIGKLDLSTFQITEYAIPTVDSQPWEIGAGADGALWFTEDDASQIGRIDLLGHVAEFGMGTTGCCFPIGIAGGPGDVMWYTLEIGNQIGRIEPGSGFTLFTIPTVQVLPWDIAPGPDGNMWFTELAGRAIGRITPSGAITEFPIAGAFSGIAGITTGSDGHLYFTENDTHQVSGMTLAGDVFETWPTSERPLSICAGPDGNLWFTIADGNRIGRWEIAQPGTRHVLSQDAGFVPAIRDARLGETVQWSFTGPAEHSVADASGMNLFASGPKSPVSFHSFRVRAAGAYVYRDISPAFRRGAIDARVEAPAGGQTGVPFPVTWAVPSLPAGFVEDVEVRLPGGSSFLPWVSSTERGAPYTPAVAGQYQFRARLRSLATGKTSGWSRPTVVTVS